MRDSERWKKKKKRHRLVEFWTWRDFKKKVLTLETKKYVLLKLYILVPSRGQMAQHPILLGAVQTYKITDVPSSTQRMGMANSQLLNVYVISAWCNIFCLSLFLTYCLDHLCANPGCAILPACQQLCHEHKSQVQKAECASGARTSTAAPTKMLQRQETEPGSGMNCSYRHGALGLQFSL